MLLTPYNKPASIKYNNRDLLSIIEPNTIITNKNKDNTFKKTPPHINTILYRNECGLFN